MTEEVVSVGEGEGYAAIARKKNAKVNYQVDLIDEIWEEPSGII